MLTLIERLVIVPPNIWKVLEPTNVLKKPQSVEWMKFKEHISHHFSVSVCWKRKRVRHETLQEAWEVSPFLVLSGGHVCAPAGQRHIPDYRACGQCDDNRGCHSRRHFTSQVSLGNENAIYIWTTWILLCEFSPVSLLIYLGHACFT